MRNDKTIRCGPCVAGRCRWFCPKIRPAIAVLILGAMLMMLQPLLGVTSSTTHPTVLLLNVPLPLRGTVDEQIRQQMDRFLETQPAAKKRPVIVLEFSTGKENLEAASQFERSFALARYLTSQRTSGVRTIAYVPGSLRGHAILVAFACDEIIMAPDAVLSEAGIGEETIDSSIRNAYRDIADRSHTVPAALALGMIDPRLQVNRVETARGTNYVLSEDLESLQENTAVTQIHTVIPAGEFGRFTGSELRLEYGFVSRLAKDRSELARILELPPHMLQPKPLQTTGQWQAIQIKLTGAVDTTLQQRVQRTIEQALREQGINFVCLWLDSPGGNPVESLRLANYLANLDSTKIRTVAFVLKEARADAALVAYACDDLVIHPDAILGGPGVYQMSMDETRDICSTLTENLARKKSTSWSLTAAMLDPGLVVYEYRLPQSNMSEYFCKAELEQQTDPGRWEQGILEVGRGDLYRIDGQRAVQVGLATHLANHFAELKDLYQLQDDPALAEPSWAETLVTALASPELSGTLLFVGGFALIFELLSPGIGAGGFVSVLCYTLFFWSQYLQGTAGWLEVMLFSLGVTCVALEMFVIPGFGIFGLGGGALVILSLVLASQTFLQFPRNEYQLHQFQISLLMVLAAGAGLIVALVVVRRYAHRLPILRTLILSPPLGEQLEIRLHRESLVKLDHLIGIRGTTTTVLSPAGKARFGEELVDVISDGELLHDGADVIVVEVRGNHVVVSRAS